MDSGITSAALSKNRGEWGNPGNPVLEAGERQRRSLQNDKSPVVGGGCAVRMTSVSEGMKTSLHVTQTLVCGHHDGRNGDDSQLNADIAVAKMMPVEEKAAKSMGAAITLPVNVRYDITDVATM